MGRFSSTRRSTTSLMRSWHSVGAVAKRLARSSGVIRLRGGVAGAIGTDFGVDGTGFATTGGGVGEGDVANIGVTVANGDEA